MTAKSFEHLLDHWTGLGPRATQELAALRLPDLARAAGFVVWHPGSEPRPQDAVLLGVASWSRLDLRFLDELGTAGGLPEGQLVIFDMADFSAQGSLESVFPELSERPDQTPLLVTLHDGSVGEVAWGAAARGRLLELASAATTTVQGAGATQPDRGPDTARDSRESNAPAVRFDLRARPYRPASTPHIGVGAVATTRPATSPTSRTPSVA